MTREVKFTEATLKLLEEMLEVEGQDPELAVSAGMNIAAKLLGAEAGAIWIRNREDGKLWAMYNLGAVDMTGVSLPADRGVEGRTATENAPVVQTMDGPKGEQTAYEAMGLAVRNLICVPLKKEHRVEGCLILVNLKLAPEEQKEALALCEHLAALSGLLLAEADYHLPESRTARRVLIRARGVVKEYPSGTEKVRVLKGINLDIFEGEFVVILGESGCGKSTLVNIISGMDNLTEGTITVEGKDFSHPTDQELTDFRRMGIGFVFQNYHLMPNLTALENIRFVADLVSDPMEPARALELVGLSERANHFPSMLSGGQQQRVSIARAIVKQPKLIFADEPTAALDYQTSIEVLSTFEQVVRNRHTTVVMITHNPEIARMADRVIRLQDGQITGVRINLKPAGARDLSW